MDKFYLFLFNILQFFVRYSPKIFLNLILKAFISLIYIVDKKHRKIAKVNLDLAYENNISDEEKEKIIKSVYKNLVYNLSDFIDNQGSSKENVLSKVVFKNDKYILDLLSNKKDFIILTAHYGNWELLSLSIAAKYTPLAIVGRDLDSELMNKILTKNREQFDIELLSKTGAMRGMIKAIKNHRPVGILVDQNTSENEGLLIDFFGKKARHTPSAAILSQKFDLPLLPAFIKTKDNINYEVEFFEPLTLNEEAEDPILELVQKQANITELIIRSKPDEWFWLHQRWKNQYESLYDV